MAKKKETTEVATKTEETALAIPEGAWGCENLAAEDILISKVLLMQGQSTIVQNGEAVPGQLIDSVTKEPMGGFDPKSKNKIPVELVAFYSTKTWVISERPVKRKPGEDKFVFQAEIPQDMDNINWPQEETIGEVEVRRDRSINFFCLKTSDVAAGPCVPILVSFRRTGYMAGKKLTSMGKKLQAYNQPLAAQVFQLGVEQQEKDGNKYWKFDVIPGRQSSKVELAKSFEWFQVVKQKPDTIKVDDSDLREDTTGGAAPSVSDTGEDNIDY